MTKIKFTHGDGGKQSGQRPSSIAHDELALRWELMSSKTSSERKEEIKIMLSNVGNDNAK